MSAIERSVRERVAGILGVPAGALDSSKALSRLGLDSLGMLQLSASLESDLGEWPGGCELTIESLEDLLRRTGARTKSPAGPRERMLADSVLPPEIRPRGGAQATPLSILLTGATGFLGAHLLSSLLQTSPARVVCLVRPGTSGAGRIRQTLLDYRIWQDPFEGRIRVVEADLSQPRLGISPLDFNALADSVDAVFHSAAAVNWVQSYAVLRNPNVVAVRELLRLACYGAPKPFHFVSTMGVCYSSSGPVETDESGDAFRDLDGVHLGYAQGKLVAETLVRTAAQRGLPVRIFRPSFISGDSVTGLSNTADFISSFIKGCVRMAAAPDLDWFLDSVPVDFVAASISRLALSGDSSTFRVFHLANPKPRHWRELILWMNLYGYRIRLLPYGEWLDRLEGETSDPAHPLRSLAPFFRSRTGATGEQCGLHECQRVYLPQLYEESRKKRVRCDATNRALAAHSLQFPGLTTFLLDRYFSAFVDQQFLPSPSPTVHRAGPRSLSIDADFFADIFHPARIVGVTPVELPASDTVIGELTSWSRGQSVGLRGYRLTVAEVGMHTKEVDVVVKVKAPEKDVREVGQEIATLCSPGLGEAYGRFSDRLGLSKSDVRELSVYRESDERLRRYTPIFHGGSTDDVQTILVLERLSGMTLMNSTDQPESWRPEHIEAAIDGLAHFHSIWYGRSGELSNRWNVGPRATLSFMVEARPLWSSLAGHAGPLFSEWCGREFCVSQRELIDSLDRWWPEVEAMPHTLIHNDCNPRNLAFRKNGGTLRLCLYDWELAALGLPQHDLAELLCFVLGSRFRSGDVSGYIERHRSALARHSGCPIEPRVWRRGFLLSLNDLMLNRLPAYAMVHRFQKQRFLERVVRSWMALKDWTESAELV